jgi:hypothetical protein
MDFADAAVNTFAYLMVIINRKQNKTKQNKLHAGRVKTYGERTAGFLAQLFQSTFSALKTRFRAKTNH